MPPGATPELNRLAKPVHEALLMRAWLTGLPLDAFAAHRERRFPRQLVEALPQIEARLEALARVVSEHPSDDGSRRLLVGLQDGQTIETVLLQRGTVCVSTQVGCRVGCTFCMTGRDGLLRNLSTPEILAQVALARRRQNVSRVVCMGMGEPAHNLDAVCEAFEWLGSEGGLPHKNLTFSTVGTRAAFARLAGERVRQQLALSLHTTNADKRRELLPRASRIAPAELIEMTDDYARRIAHPAQIQWTLLAGVNDGDDEVDALIELTRGRHVMVNFIPYNAVDGLAFRRPTWQRGVDMVRTLRRAGIVATLRRSGGQDVDAACGQLRSRSSTNERTA
ncbi:MAG: RNA methyltransferase [Planctomycetota bacterium]|nr:RNA methyltransferase [Planctomycetota bacterium]